MAEVTQADLADKRSLALIERLGTVADLACSKPLAGELGDVAYDLLRQAAAQISSDRLRLARHRTEAVKPLVEALSDLVAVVDENGVLGDSYPRVIDAARAALRSVQS